MWWSSYFLRRPLQDLHRLVDRRRIDDHRLEATLERAVLLDVLAVLVERRRADALQLSARQRRLQHVGRVDRAFGRARADERVQLVDEQDDLLVLRDLVHDRLEALLELAAILGAGDDRRHVERQHAVVAQRLRALAVGDELREPLDDRRLADAGFADEDRVVLLAAREHFHHALDFLGAPDRRIELPLGRELRQIAAEMVERRRLGLLLALGRRAARGAAAGRLLAAALRHLRAEDAQRLGAGGVEIDARVGQHLRRNPLFLTEKPKQEVLGADVAVIELARFAHRQLEHLLGARRIGKVGTGRLRRLCPS